MDNVKYVTKLISGENLYYMKDTEARDNLINKTEKGAASGVATLGTDGKVPTSQLPTIPVVNDATLTIQKNGAAVGTFTANASAAKTINITMTKSDVGLGNVDNTSDANKPISTAVQNALTALENTVESYSELSYGIQWTDANTTPVRIGNTAMHKSLPVQSMMRRCMLKDDGTVYGYIDPTDYTKYLNGETVDYTGAHGQYMVEVPEYWFTAPSTTSGTTIQHQINIYPTHVSGTTHSPKYYIGAVEASTNDSSSDTTKMLYSICTANVTYDSNGSIIANQLTYADNAANYRGGNRNTSYDGTIKTLLGKPATNLTRAAFRTRAAARGTGWSQQYWDAYMAWVRLYVVEYCSFNSQAAFNANKTADGYMQGGLGNGVLLNGTIWNNFNNYNPFIICGATRSLGNSSGVVNYKFAAGEIDTGSYTFTVPSYRGIENPFAHIWKYTDGLNAYCDGTTKKTTIYTCNDITKFADNTATNYTLRTSDMYQGSNGWIKTRLADEHGDFIPLTIGGSQSSYLYDYFWADNTGWRVLLSGGRAYNGARCGLFYFDVNPDSSNAVASIGGRVYYTPLE